MASLPRALSLPRTSTRATDKEVGGGSGAADAGGRRPASRAPFPWASCSLCVRPCSSSSSLLRWNRHFGILFGGGGGSSLLDGHPLLEVERDGLTVQLWFVPPGAPSRHGGLLGGLGHPGNERVVPRDANHPGIMPLPDLDGGDGGPQRRCPDDVLGVRNEGGGGSSRTSTPAKGSAMEARAWFPST